MIMQLMYFFNLALLFLAMCASRNNDPRESHPADTAVIDAMKEDSVPVSEKCANCTLDFVMGRFDPASHPDFILIDTMHADRPGLYLQKETYRAFRKMYEAALKDGIRLQIRSATRNFAYQKSIWESKWTGETLIESGQNASTAFPDPAQRATMILKYSSMPGSSRHHWGTDIDLNAFDNSWFESGTGLDIYNWLSEHAGEFGFCQPYSAKGEERPHGYEEERWHWSYLPLSQPLTHFAADSLKDEMIKGFLGAETATKLKIVERYVLGIDKECF